MLKFCSCFCQLAALSLLLAWPAPAMADQEIIAPPAGEAPLLDGSCNEAAWRASRTHTIRDKRVNVDIVLKSVHTKDMLFFCVQFPDPEENRLHKPWIWDGKLGLYTIGPQMGDTFMFRWNMGKQEVDLSDFSDDTFTADVWYWKANRTDPVGYADDMFHTLTETETKKSRPMQSRAGKTRYLLRLADEGTPAYEGTIELDYRGDLLPQYKLVTPTGSRADVKAKGVWKDKRWTIEFARKLDTGHGDDLQFTAGAKGRYLFGVSIKALYGEPLDDKANNLYGQGRISEPLRLILK